MARCDCIECYLSLFQKAFEEIRSFTEESKALRLSDIQKSRTTILSAGSLTYEIEKELSSLLLKYPNKTNVEFHHVCHEVFDMYRGAVDLVNSAIEAYNYVSRSTEKKSIPRYSFDKDISSKGLELGIYRYTILV
jgi:hypothetical protein